MGNSQSSTAATVARLNDPIDGVYYEVEGELEPFGEGSCRYAFRGVYRGDGPKRGKKCVWKAFKEPSMWPPNAYMDDINISRIAQQYADRFNAEYASRKPLTFIQPRLATVTDVPSNEYVNVGDQIVVEDSIKGKFDKFNSNGGFEDDAVAAVPSFSHFTFHESGGQLIVCDIQGVRLSDRYVLTDPAILSRRQGEYGPTDIGPVGMAAFFDAHQCTKICRNMMLPDVNPVRRINRRQRNSKTYTYQLNESEKETNRFFSNRPDLPAIAE